MKWRFIDSGPQEAAFNMALDEAIFISVIEGKSPPTLRFYSWAGPSLSIGYFQNHYPRPCKIRDDNEINLSFCLSNNIPVVRRPTGGKAILHGNELTYSFSSLYLGPFTSKDLYEIYKLISYCFLDAMKRLGIPVEISERKKVNYSRNAICFMSTSYGEVTLFGKKILGSAQKRLNTGFLQQGSLPYYIKRDLLKKIFNLEDKNDTLYNLKGLFEILSEKGIPLSEEEVLKSEIIKVFETNFGIEFIKEEPSNYEMDLASARVSTLKTSRSH